MPPLYFLEAHTKVFVFWGLTHGEEKRRQFKRKKDKEEIKDNIINLILNINKI